MAKLKKTSAETAEEPTPLFSKTQILKSHTFAAHRDILSGKLIDNKNYSIAEVNMILSEFLKGQVK